jgi:DNA-binding MarR family transcriptional regulator
MNEGLTNNDKEMNIKSMIQDDFLSCLYFLMTSAVRRMDETAIESFREAGFCPSHAFIMMLVINTPGLNIREISDILHLAPSTTSRFLDKLEHKGLIRKEASGKMKRIYPTPRGSEKNDILKKCWENVREGLVSRIGEECLTEFTAHMSDFYGKL